MGEAVAYDLMLRALRLIRRLDREPFMQAGAYLAHAIQLEPDFAAAHAHYAYWHGILVGQGWAIDAKAVMRQAQELADRAMALDPADARVLTITGHVRAFLCRRPHEAASLHSKALSLNPNLSMAWALSAVTHAYMGELDEAEIRYQRYKKLSPLDPSAFMFDNFSTLIHLLKRDPELAVAAGLAATQLAPSLSAGLKPYLSALGHSGRTRDTDIVYRRLLTTEPDFTVERYVSNSPLERASDKQYVADGLLLAGVPATSI